MTRQAQWALILLILPLLACGASDEPGSSVQAAEADPVPEEGKATSTESGEHVVGTIRAVLDGKKHVWYAVEAEVDGEMLGTALWMENTAMPIGPNRAANVTAFGRVEDGLSTLLQGSGGSQMPANLANAAHGGLFSITFRFEPDQESVEAELSMMSAFSGITAFYIPAGEEEMLQFQSGELKVDRIEASKTGAGRFTGSFHGQLHRSGTSSSGETIELTDGRIDVTGARYLGPPAAKEAGEKKQEYVW